MLEKNQESTMIKVSRKCVKAQRFENGSQRADMVCMPLTRVLGSLKYH